MEPALVTPATAALWFLPFVLPICIWAAWSDMKYLKIPNAAVLALTGVYLVVGPIALPLDDYLWRLLHLVVVLVIGFVLNMARLIGAGDAKFAAAMAPFIAREDALEMMLFFAAVLIAAFLTHRLFQSSKAFRRMTEGWESWDTKDFPMGLALGSVLVFYLVMVVRYGVGTPLSGG